MNEELRVLITAEINKLKQGVDNAKKHIGNFKDEVKKASKDVDKNFAAIGTSINNAAKTIGVAVAGAVAGLAGMSAATAEYRNNQAKLKTAFEDAGSSAATATQVYNDLYRVLGDDGQTTEAASHLAKLTNNQQDLSEWVNISKGIYAQFGDSIPIEAMAEGALEASKTGTITAGLTDALVWAGVAEDEFNAKLQACATEQEREALIRTTLNGLYSDAAAKYEENNAKVLAQNEANASLTATMASLGEKMAPVITAFTNFASGALAVVEPYISNLTANLLPVLQGLLDGIISALEIALNWITQHSDAIGIIAGVIGGLVTAIGLYNTVAAVKAAMDAAQVTTLWGLVSAYAAQAAAMIVAIAPYALIVAAIVGVIAIIMNWEEVLQWIKDVWANVSKWVSEKVQAMGEAVGKWFGNMGDAIKNKLDAAKSVVSNAVNAIKEFFNLDAMKNKVLNTFDSLKQGISDKINAAKNAVSNVVNAIKGFFNFKFELPSIPKPSFGISPSGWVIGDLLKGVIPKLSIKWNAMGGVFERPTLTTYGGTLQGLGEAGAEAIVPLEKNTKWLDVIADKLSERHSNQPIVLTVDGKVFAQTSIEAINNLTRQRGSLALNLV